MLMFVNISKLYNHPVRLFSIIPIFVRTSAGQFRLLFEMVFPLVVVGGVFETVDMVQAKPH